MQRIFAPWRIRYVLAPKYKGCVFCDFPAEEKDDERLIVYRGERSFVIMNRYPYNPGHTLVAPYRHAKDIEELSNEELLELMKDVRLTLKVIRKVMNPDGFNVGINIGEVAGAGMAEHLHVHIVPRWDGDSSFMPILADVQVVPEALEETYKKLKDAFNKD
jgi:ATP adenylyltransferase